MERRRPTHQGYSLTVLYAAHIEVTRIVHFAGPLVAEALCGEAVGFHGEPDIAVVCDDCLAEALEAGHDVTLLVADDPVPVVLRLAA